MNTKKKHVLITGASRGLGKALALEFLKNNYNVTAVARHHSTLDQLANEGKNFVGALFCFSADIGAKNDIHRITGAAAGVFGKIDIVINNASTLGRVPMPLLLDTACEELESVLQTNLVGPFRMTKALLSPMILGGSGTIVNISSDAALDAYPSWGSYSVSKAALDALTRVWAQETPGVTFYSVDPGEMHTQMHADALPDADVSVLENPKDIAEKIFFLIENKHLPSGSRTRASELEVPL